MTNNPTIDGVSLLPCPFCGGDAVLKQYRADGLEIRCTGCQSMRQQRWVGKGRGWLETKMIENWNERATPAAELQEPVVLLREHRKGLAAYLEQIKDQQTTIARLEARIAELESGRGEPVAWQYRVSAGPATGWSLWHDGKGDEFRNSYQVENRPLFTAPPAPVEVVLPPFAEKVISKLRRCEECFSDFDSGGVDIGRHWLDLLTQLGLLNRVQRSPAMWEITQQGEDCLDATAALNNKPSTEVNP